MICMSREIKFRALRNGKTWWYSSDDGIYFKGGYLYEFDDIDIDTNIGTAYQYTGLKDKNKKEVFEGDIVMLNHITSKGYIFEVEYTKEARFIFNDKKRKVKRFPNHGTEKWVEVIGNIYESHELLEQS